MSSHVGDEFLIKNQTFNRINYVRESIIFGTSLQASRECRLYGELAWGAIATGGAEPWQFQLGTEFSPIAELRLEVPHSRRLTCRCEKKSTSLRECRF